MILIGLGANLDGPYGSPEQALCACLNVLREMGVDALTASHIWKTAPVPVSDQPWYSNAVCLVETSHSPDKLLKLVKDIEIQFGRKENELNAPRVIDIDVLAYGQHIVNDGNFVLPHPRMHSRAFVLYPLREVVPDWRHPVLGKSVDEMIMDLPSGQELKRLEGSCLM